MKFGIIVFPGSNCDRDMQFALQDVLGFEVIMLWHKDTDLSMFSAQDCIVLPGGFSYGDYLRCGAIARFSPLMQPLIRFAENGGLVLGVCNGFQILCESHLLPGVLLRNANQQFIGKNIYLKTEKGEALKIPIAHGEGRYYADDKLSDEMETGGQVIWKYCDAEGNITPRANPNGSTRSIAGICNKERNVFGLMPHPERAVSETLGNTRWPQIVSTDLQQQEPTFGKPGICFGITLGYLTAMNKRSGLFLLFISIFFFKVHSQDSTAVIWQSHTEKNESGEYHIVFDAKIKPGWQLYGPNQDLSGTPSFELNFADSSFSLKPPFITEGKSEKRPVALFDNASFILYSHQAKFSAPVRIKGIIPAHVFGSINYFYSKADSFYSGNFAFSTALEGGVNTVSRIRINSFDLKHPVSPCGDSGTAGKGLVSIFLLGLLGGFIALLTPCVFPLIPLTVSFFTKSSSSGKAHAFLYGFFIFLIYVLLSLPFYLLDHVNPEILNTISTSIWLNLFFFVIFVVFAISFFGYFDITLPGSVANSVNSKSGATSLLGIFFMALTLAIVSFSCTGPILGSLLVGALSNNGGAIQLSVGMGGFGLGLALPFAIFALFPGWLGNLPKSGGWLGSVRVVLGFLELAMAIKFLSNADLVEQWGILKREIFIGIWVIIGFLITMYLMGRIRFPHDSPVKKFSTTRIGFLVFFGLATFYLIPGLTNTKAANLTLISGFPPPLCYSVYKEPVNCAHGVEPLRDYEQAIALAKKLNKPVLIDFTGWACVNCRRMEENVWTDPEVRRRMLDSFVVVSLYVDDRRLLPAASQTVYSTMDGARKNIITVGDKWATFQSENFHAVSQPQYALISPDEKVLTYTKGYTPKAQDFTKWLDCGLAAFRK